jgi:isoquinoline 1-oxidoreductase
MTMKHVPETEAGSAGPPTPVPLVVNGEAHEAPPSASLLSILRGRLGLTGAKPGCGEGACGACTVLADGEPVRACQETVASLGGRTVVTIEGLASGSGLHAVQQAFVDAGAVQCGYCTPAMVLAVTALLDHDAHPTPGAIGEALAGIVCRCGIYPRIGRAVARAVDLLAAAPEPGTGSEPEAAGVISPPEPASPGRRPARPWDLTSPEACDWFDVLGDGLVVVMPPREPPPGTWTTGGGAWLHARADGTVTAFTGKVDVGQDNRTALRLLVAEELRVPLSHVHLMMGDTDLCPYDRGTFGSRSMPDAGNALRRVAACARALFPVVAGTRRVEVVAGDAELTPPGSWRTAGRPHHPAGSIDAVTGRRRFVSDLTLPGLWHGVVLRPPAQEAVLRRVDLRRLDGRTDVVVVRTPTLLGLAAADMGTARSALADVHAEWDVPEAPAEADLAAYLRSHPAPERESWLGSADREDGDPDGALGTAAVRDEATYTAAYIAAASLETRAAIAVWDDDGRLTIWTGTQTPFPVRAQVAAALEIGEERVRVVVPATGGGFGGKHTAGVAIEAAVIARQIGRPVRVAWSRREEFSVGTLRPAAVIDVAAGVSSDGDLTAWSFTNVNSGPSAITPPYRVPNLRVRYQPAAGPLPQGSYRALAATANNFARESHIDVLAHRIGLDPVDFRLRNLDDERLVAVLRAAADAVDWAGREVGAGWGIACGLEKDARVATVAQVRMGSDGALGVIALLTAYECGAVVNPDTVINQIEGATVMALGGALFEAVHFSGGMVSNGAFSAYRVPRMPDVPLIDVVLLDRPDLPSAGAGETPMIAVAPAIANAVFDATGRRLRSLPLAPDGRLS